MRINVRSRVFTLIGVVGLQVGTGAFHAVLGNQDYILSFYYINIIIAAAVWGYLGGMVCASIATALLLVISWKQPLPDLSSGALYVLFFYLFALMVGKVVEDQQVIHRLAVTDALTGVFNRHHFMQQLHAELERSKRYGGAMTLLMVDVDHFKRYNDRFGHQKGDQVLREIAYILRSYVRSSDTVYRYGGEEFAVILPGVCAEQAYVVAERLRKMIEERVATFLRLPQPVTVSVGIADCRDCISAERSFGRERDAEARHNGERHPPSTEGIDLLLEKADQALYQAKQEGRNRVSIWGTSPSLPPTPAKVGGKVLPFEVRS